jgi:hypothetical protein
VLDWASEDWELVESIRFLEACGLCVSCVSSV